jgi:hypothetical protein
VKPDERPTPWWFILLLAIMVGAAIAALWFDAPRPLAVWLLCTALVSALMSPAFRRTRR